MDKRIWKYEIPIEDKVIIHLPLDSKVLFVGVQDGTIYLWVLHDLDRPKAPRIFIVVGTGHKFPSGYFTHIGTVQIKNVGLVFHIFEEA